MLTTFDPPLDEMAPNLKYFEATGNSLQRIPPFVSRHTELQELHLAKNDITEIEPRQFAEAESLSVISLNGNNNQGSWLLVGFL